MDRVRAARALKAQWSDGTGLPAQDDLPATLRAEPGITDETLVNKGTAVAPRPEGAKALTATYFWPMQSHASIGPSCAVADVQRRRARRCGPPRRARTAIATRSRASSACRARRCG